MKKYIIIFCLILFISCSENQNTQTNSSSFSNIEVEREYDFLLHLAEAEISAPNVEYIHPMWKSIGEKTLWSIFQHATSEIVFSNVPLSENATLSFSYGMLETSYTEPGDGVRFEIDIQYDDIPAQKIFSDYIDPKNNEKDRKWHTAELSIQPSNSNSATIIFRTLNGDKSEDKNSTADWAIWGSPILQYNKSLKKNTNQKPNIVVITIDTCRKDYIGCYGNTWINTPTIDQMAQEGIVFEKGYAASATTLPSHVSILTSLKPFQHGVIGNDYKMAEAIPTLQLTLVEEGYDTGAAVSVFHLSDEISGLGNGFNEYRQVDESWRKKLSGDLAYLTRGGRQTTNAAIEWLDQERDSPFFLWIHYYDPHFPYIAEADYHKKFYAENPKDPKHTSMQNAVYNHLWIEYSKHWLEGITDLDYLKKEYAAEISFVDSQIKRLYSVIDELGQSNNTITVITADHGENLGEHNIYFDHWTMFDTDIHIPFIIHYPQKIQGNTRIEHPVAHIDIAPTLLDMAGFSNHFYIKNKVYQGDSLVPLWKKQKGEPPRVVESNAAFYDQIAYISEPYKVIWELRKKHYNEKSFLNMDRVWIFNRKSDPQENDPIGCFYWGTENDIHRFYSNLNNDYKELEKKLQKNQEQDISENVHKRVQLQLAIQKNQERLEQKKSITENILRECFNSKREGTFLKEEYRADEKFFLMLVNAMNHMKESVSSATDLKTILNRVPNIAAMEESKKTSNVLLSKEIQDDLSSIGYGNN
jgi:arylsulfatase A-like enzyme